MNERHKCFENKIGLCEQKSKYSNYTKQGSSNSGNNTLQKLIKIQQQKNKSKKESE